MKISKDDVIKVAKLAHIDLVDSELDDFAKKFEDVFSYIDTLNDVSLDGVEPTDQVTGKVNATRPDEVVDYGASQKDLLNNAPDTQGEFIKVKRILK